MRYVEVEENLKTSINTKGLSLLFAQSIKDLKVNFGVEVSTKFLRGLSDLNSKKKKKGKIKKINISP